MGDIEILDRFMYAFGQSPTLKQWFKLNGKEKKKAVPKESEAYRELLSNYGYDKPNRGLTIRIYDTRNRLAFCGTLKRAMEVYPFLTITTLKSGVEGHIIYGGYNVERVDIDAEMNNIFRKDFWEMDLYKYRGHLHEDDKEDF